MIKILIDYLPNRQLGLVSLALLTILSMIMETAVVASVIPVMEILQGSNTSDWLRYFNNIQDKNNVWTKELHVLLLTISLIIFSLIVRLFLIYYQARIANLTGGSLAKALIQNYILIPITEKKKIKVDIMSSIYAIKIPQIIGQMINPIINIFVNTVLIIGLCIFLVITNYKLFILLIITYVSIYCALILITRNYLTKSSILLSDNSDLSLGYLQEMTKMYRDIQNYNLWNYFKLKFISSDKKIRDTKANIEIIKRAPRVIIDSFTILIIVCVAFYYSGQPQPVSIIPTLGAFAVASQKLIPGIQQIFISWSAIKSGRKSVDHVISTIEEFKGVTHDIKKTTSEEQTIDFEKLIAEAIKVKFGEKVILENVTFEITHGDKIIVMGPSGSGKSTLIDVMTGTLPIESGELNFTAGDFLPDVKKKLSIVSQDNLLLQGSVIENITCFDPNVDDRSLLYATEMADISDDILYSCTTENLSGGQRQRIAIARALYRRPSVLMLDEATSSLDSLSAKKIMQKLIQDDTLTLIAITHDVQLQMMFKKEIWVA
jgi:ATP-binding cassette subfamily B protein